MHTQTASTQATRSASAPAMGPLQISEIILHTRHFDIMQSWYSRLFDGLKPDVRAKLIQSLPDVAWARKQVADTEGPKMKEFQSKGGFVHHLTVEQREAWAKVARTGQQEMVDSIGGKAKELFDALQQGKKVWAEKHEKK